MLAKHIHLRVVAWKPRKEALGNAALQILGAPADANSYTRDTNGLILSADEAGVGSMRSVQRASELPQTDGGPA